jgi:hypothetical protein
MWGQVDQRIRSALRGIRLAFRGRLTRVKSDLIIQQVQVKGLAGEQLQDAEFFSTSVSPVARRPGRSVSFCRWVGRHRMPLSLPPRTAHTVSRIWPVVKWPSTHQKVHMCI